MDLVTEQKLERRERILSAARELLAERGYEAITVRDLAAASRVSVPTLYNQFGSKDRLLAAAIGSHFSGLLASAPSGDEWSGAARLTAVVGLCADEVAARASYHRALLLAFMSVRETAPLQSSLAGGLADELERGLEEMRGRRQLVSWASPPVLARRITAACIACSVGWVMGDLNDRTLRAAMIHAAASMTLGVARGAARVALEAECRAAQDELARADTAEARDAASG